MSGIPAGAGSLLGKRLGKYEILALLALGGTAEIYLARIGGAAGFEKYVVVKCLHDHLADDPEFVKMFLDEARLAAQLDHSNIVQTMELGEYENRYYMVMEFLAGLSLAMVVRRAGERLAGGRIPVPLTVNIIAQACAGLHYAHEKTQNGKPLNIVHRDISPQNLVVSFEGVVKVVDFGIAKAEHRETQTRSGTIKGKFAYMSPEQCIAAQVDRRTDVFALGVIAHELLTGRRLFKKPSPYETYQAVIECNVDLPSKLNHELDPALDPVIMKALTKDKDQRYQTAEAFGDALLGYLHHRGKGSGPGDVARFFDTSFAQEIEEHGARMRELISGRDNSIEAPLSWEEQEEEERKRNETVDLGAKLGAVERPSAGSLTSALDDLDEVSEAGDDENMPAERTRIEANPLEALKLLDEVVQKQHTPKPQLVTPRPERIPQPPPARPGELPNQAHQMPVSGPLPLPPTPPPGSKFPALAHLPTQVHIDDPAAAPAEKAPPELARTELAGKIIDPNARTGLDMRAPELPPQPPVMASYPVMNREMSEQIARGADVFPSAPTGATGSHRPAPELSPSRAFNLASPVGQQYPDGTDWAAAAATPAKPIPPWLLGVLFVLALGVALGLTIGIAKLAS